MALPAGSVAFWNAEVKSVTCLDCVDGVVVQAAGEADVADAPPDSVESEPEPLDRGKAGASAVHSYERLRIRREQRARDRFGRLSGVYLALTDDPQSTVAWAQGGRGEQLLGGYLEKIHDERVVVVLHDRRIPGTRANIDHIAITRSGAVWAIDAKNYAG
jgi:hypothetical protein